MISIFAGCLVNHDRAHSQLGIIYNKVCQCGERQEVKLKDVKVSNTLDGAGEGGYLRRRK